MIVAIRVPCPGASAGSSSVPAHGPEAAAGVGRRLDLAETRAIAARERSAARQIAQRAASASSASSASHSARRASIFGPSAFSSSSSFATSAGGVFS